MIIIPQILVFGPTNWYVKSSILADLFYLSSFIDRKIELLLRFHMWQADILEPMGGMYYLGTISAFDK